MTWKPWLGSHSSQGFLYSPQPRVWVAPDHLERQPPALTSCHFTKKPTPNAFLSQVCYNLLQPPLKGHSRREGPAAQLSHCRWDSAQGAMEGRKNTGLARGWRGVHAHVGAERARVGWKQSRYSPGTLTWGNKQIFKPIVSTAGVTIPLPLSPLLHPYPSGFLCHIASSHCKSSVSLSPLGHKEPIFLLWDEALSWLWHSRTPPGLSLISASCSWCPTHSLATGGPLLLACPLGFA